MKNSIIEGPKKIDLFPECRAETSHCYSDQVSGGWGIYPALQASLGGQKLQELLQGSRATFKLILKTASKD